MIQYRKLKVILFSVAIKVKVVHIVRNRMDYFFFIFFLEIQMIIDNYKGQQVLLKSLQEFFQVNNLK